MADPQTISILGCGWLGLSLAEALVAKGWQVKGATTRAEKLPILKAKGIIAYQVQVEPEAVLSNPTDFFDSNILLINIPPGRRRPDVEQSHPAEIRQVLAHALTYQVKQVLFISSTSVYGNVNGWVSEESEAYPQTASGKALQEVEQLLRTESAFKTSILRLAGLVGGNRQAGRFFAGRNDLPGGEVPVNMVHRDDVIGVILALLDQEKWGYLFNVCADEHPMKKDFYPAQAKKQGLAAPHFLTNDQSPFKIVSNALVKKELGYSFKYPDPMSF